MPKPAQKPASHKKVPGIPFAKDDPRINRTMPGPGRTPDAFKAMCQALACSAHEAALEALKDSKHPAFIGALKWATEHGYGRPEQPVTHSGDIALNVVIRDESAK